MSLKMLWKSFGVVSSMLMLLQCSPCSAKGNPGKPPYSNFITHVRGYQFRGNDGRTTTTQWRPYQSTTRWPSRSTIGTTGPTCRYGSRFDCCYGWRRDHYGRCQPVCDRTCVHGTCIGRNQCQCEQGYHGHTCERDVNECSTRPCQHRCMNTPGSYRCYCEEGFTLRSDQSSCMYDRRCDSLRCSYGCQEQGYYKVMCICPDGLRVAGNGYSCLDINECAEIPGLCPIDKRCHNTYGSYTCLCKLGLSYKFIDGKYQCSDEDECATRRHNCHRFATCTNKVRSYTCECNEGYGGNGTYCVPVDPSTCFNRPCFTNVTCTDRNINPRSIGSLLPNTAKIRLYLCGPCPGGYVGDGVNCQRLPPSAISVTTKMPTTTDALTTTVLLTTTTMPTTTVARTTTLATTAPPTTTVTTTAPPTTTVTTTVPPTTTVTTTAPPTTTVTTTAPPTTTVTTTSPPTTTVTTTAPLTTTLATTAPPTTTVATTNPTTKEKPFFRTSGPEIPQGEQAPEHVSTTIRGKEESKTTSTPKTTTQLTTTVTTEPPTTTVTTTAPPTTTTPLPTTTPTTRPPTTTPPTTTVTTTPPTTTPPTTPPTTTPATTPEPTTFITTTTIPPTTTPPPPSVTLVTVDRGAQKALLPEVGIKVMIPDETENATRIIINETTGYDGIWKILIPEDQPVIISASKMGFLDTSYVYKFRPNEKNMLTIEMSKPSEVEQWKWKSGYYKKIRFGDLNDIAKEYRVEIAPGALNVIEGAEVTMRFTTVNMADKDALTHAPELIAAVPNGRGGFDMEGLEVYAMAEASFYETDTYDPIEVMLPVVIEMPLPEEVQTHHGDQLEAWYFNTDRGVWMKAGKGVVEFYRGGVLIWRYRASHFTWWAVGRTFHQTNCVQVYACSDSSCNNPIPNVPVRLTGVDFFYSASKVTNEHGQTCFHFKKQGQVKIFSPCIERIKFSQGRGKPSMCPAHMNSEIIQTKAKNTIDSCASVRLVANRGATSTCEDPGTLDQGIVVGSDFTYGSHVTFFCGPSTYMLGAPQRACLDCGEWGGSNPTCELMDNAVPLPEENVGFPSQKPFSNAQAATTTESATKTFKPFNDQPKKRKRRRRRPKFKRPGQ
ncbi:uncharacterized protein [Asterias amurensis]|uniref:uncharacterized protein n=1 Tax=Asterias amurensis TaxID=7602 RepID=UPI003AB35482